MIEKTELDVLKAYHEGLLFNENEIFHHLDITNFDRDRWQKYERISKQWSCYKLEELKFYEYSDKLKIKTEKIS